MKKTIFFIKASLRNLSLKALMVAVAGANIVGFNFPLISSAPLVAHAQECVGTAAITKVAGGFGHSLALKTDGTVLSFGRNAEGQLGDGTNSTSNIPVSVSVLTGITEISAGGFHSLALKNDGTVWAWGSNSAGQLGDNTTILRNTPVQVKGPGAVGFLTDVLAISGGGASSYALKSDGTVWAWGTNFAGQLGDGTTIQQLTPVQVSGLVGITAISGGQNHALALKSDGTAWAWGANSSQQLGDGTSLTRTTPVQVSSASGLTGVTAIAAGFNHSLAIKSDGTAWAWGRNAEGQLGRGNTAGTFVPVGIIGTDGNFVTGFTALSGGQFHSAARKSDGTVFAWGLNTSAQVGDGTFLTRFNPVPVIGLSGITAVDLGAFHGFAVRNDGAVLSWGGNDSGQLGNGSTGLNTNLPVSVDTGGPAVALSAGAAHSLAIRSNNTVWAWGQNNTGALGVGDFVNRLSPARVTDLDPTPSSQVIAVVAAGGGSHSLALKSDGTVWAWGSGGNGQLGNGSLATQRRPVQVKGVNGVGFLTGIIAIAAGETHSLALSSTGAVFAWGNNSFGQLGTNNFVSTVFPAQVRNSDTTFLIGVTAIAASGLHSLALKNDNTVRAWGRNAEGQLGLGFFVPTTITGARPVGGGLNSVSKIVAGDRHSLAIKSDGTAWAWGLNSFGQLGDGTLTARNLPVQVSGPTTGTFLTGVMAIEGGQNHSLATTSDGKVWGWGNNQNAQLGDGTTTTRLRPVQVLGGLMNATMLGAGTNHSSALRNDGTIWSWGTNLNGALGDGGVVSIAFTPLRTSGFFALSTTKISSGNAHTLAVKGDGLLLGWGTNSSSQLDSGTVITPARPIQINIANVASARGGSSHSLAMKNDGSAWAWGLNNFGQLGDGTFIQRSTPVPVSELTSGVTAVASGNNYSFALMSDGQVWAWGGNGFGQLGDGTNINRTIPNQVFELSDVIAISAGGFSVSAHSLVLKSDGTVWAWGRNNFGQLGDGTNNNSAVPIQVFELSDVIAISAGEEHSLAVKSDGTVWAWGANVNGELGNGSLTGAFNTPEQVPGLTGVIKVAAGQYHSLAQKSDGTVFSWGLNANGQLGDGTYVSPRRSPVQVQNLINVVDISGGELFSTALDSNGQVWSWGSYSGSRLGSEVAPTPKLVSLPSVPGDFTPPTITSVNVTPAIVGTTASINITKTVTDASGVASVTARVSKVEAGGGRTLVGTVNLTRTDGTPENGTWTGSFTFSGSATDGSYIISDFAADSCGNATPTEIDDGTIILDRTPPIINVITISPDYTPSGQNITVQVAATDSTTGFADQNAVTAKDLTTNTPAIFVSFTGSLVAGQTGNWAFNQPVLSPEGTHNEEVRATDVAGNTAVASGDFIVDDTPPDTFIDSSPPTVTNNPTALFTFSGTDNFTAPDDLIFECSLDGSGIGGGGEFSTCTSPLSFNVSDGRHIFRVRAIDRAGTGGGDNGDGGGNDGGADLSMATVTGNIDPTPASYTWLVDTVAPTTTPTLNDSDNDGLIESVTLNAIDPGAPAIEVSGVRDITYTVSDSIGGQDPTVPGNTTTISLAGLVSPVQITFHASDNANNVETTQEITINVDACPTIAGTEERQGCLIADKNTVDLHSVFLGSPSGSNKQPLQGVVVRVFDRNSPAFQAVTSGFASNAGEIKNPNGANYGLIYEANQGRIGKCVTNADGVCFAGESAAGDYLVIIKFVDESFNPPKVVYVGRPKSPSDFVDTNNDGVADLATKEFQVIKVYRNGEFVEYRGGSKLVVNGSYFEVIKPDSAIWEDLNASYPFIFTTDSEWTVDVCASVPVGYRIIGYYDSNGNLVSDQSCAVVTLNNESKVISFEAVETSSPEPYLNTTLKIKHNGKTTKYTFKVSDLRLKSFNKMLNKKGGKKVAVKMKKSSDLTLSKTFKYGSPASEMKMFLGLIMNEI